MKTAIASPASTKKDPATILPETGAASLCRTTYASLGQGSLMRSAAPSGGKLAGPVGIGTTPRMRSIRPQDARAPGDPYGANAPASSATLAYPAPGSLSRL